MPARAYARHRWLQQSASLQPQPVAPCPARRWRAFAPCPPNLPGAQGPALENPNLGFRASGQLLRHFTHLGAGVQDKGKRLRMGGLAGKPATRLGRSASCPAQIPHALTKTENPADSAYIDGVFAGRERLRAKSAEDCSSDASVRTRPASRRPFRVSPRRRRAARWARAWNCARAARPSSLHGGRH